MSGNGWRYIVALFLSTLFLAVAGFAAGWAAFWALDALDVNLALPGVGTLVAAPAEPVTGETDLEVFWEAMELLDENFYDQEALPEDEELTYAAIEGVVQATGDPHTAFLDPEQAAMVASTLEGQFEGIGAQVEMSDEGLVIVAPFPGTPAAEVGLQPGDVVLEVDGQPTAGLDVMEAVAMVRGPEGTQVTLTVLREGVAEPLEFDITRANVIIPIVETELITEEGVPPIGYIRLYDFGAQSVEQFREGVQSLLDQGAERLIVDLRNNPGGYLDSAVEITSEFVDEGIILSERGTNGRENTYPALEGGVAPDIPLVVLINEGSASASEIFAGAVRDLDRGTLIGTTTFGKGSVQLTHTLSDESNLRVTIARWFTPAGTAIHEVGIEPDIIVPVDPETLEEGEDPQLDAAIEFFRENS